jgi:hypothetical protein
VLVIILLIAFTGCEAVKTERDHLLINTMDELRQQIEEENWDSALTQVGIFEKRYEQRKWKLQLLGELGDYKEIEIQLIKLNQALTDKDKTEASVSTNQIIYLLNTIYNL